MRKFTKQVAIYSILSGVFALISPVSVAAKDVKSINLYGIDTGLIVTNKSAFSETEVIAIVASVIVGLVLIANGKVIRRLLNK